MCGIFGYFDRKGEALSEAQILAMGSAIRHRGPDDQGIYSEPGVALGNQRLSIIDIAGGHQPFVSDDGQIIVVQNGEIFNHIELAAELAGTPYACRTHSDTEVLLRLYERGGLTFLDKLNGMFAIAILDRREGALYLVRDRIGVKPLYVADDGQRLTFGSEIKAITPGLRQPATLDLEALHHFLTFNYVPAPHTMHGGIRHVMPGHVMKITRANVTSRRWWDLAQIGPVHDRPEQDWIEEFNAILDDAVRIRMRSDVPFGAFLSGGVDSSTIVGLMARHASEPIKTFCIGFEDPRYDEAPFAEAAARRFGTEHVMRRVDPDMLELWPMAVHHCDQPHGDISFLPTYRVSELAAEHVKVVLTGDGGDELFAGYDKYANFFAQPEISALDDDIFQRRYFDSISLFSDAGKLGLYTPNTRRAVEAIDSFDIARQWFDQVPHQDRINQALFLDMQLLLSGNNLVKPDRMGMAVSIEARTPFLDYRMMEYAFRMPGHLKLKDGITKYLYKKAVAPLIGDELAYRKKQMFTVPVGDWFRDRLSGYCRQHVDGVLEKSSIFNQKALYDMLDEHMSGKENRTREIRSILSVGHWIES
ncbi:asparagine synthase (glutamine-hydrolyzing) [Sphingomonas sp. C3-2]|uniref:asparagine synthase (glutamine-hydrolyzing) n=1 Tax=Sphingomonas sp. C3-2 TaxID=3062169 RepID=UPI00294B2473|nr:asparagine synthase (glutamine-hydrolyzing) [Sphingomonas sp. C3-2]WOK35097.1 asparagine synthase (glutamine-hydrolyzing) [Sphingomonas sp. C3-2]